MTHRASAGTTASDVALWARAVVQRHADDVVVAAARFKPNAAGRFDLSPAGFGQRAILKSQGAYLAERLLVGVTPLHVHVVRLVFGGRLARPAERWERDEIDVVPVPSHGRELDPVGLALRVARRTGRPLAELQPLHRDRETERVVDLLLSRRVAPRLVS